MAQDPHTHPWQLLVAFKSDDEMKDTALRFRTGSAAEEALALLQEVEPVLCLHLLDPTGREWMHWDRDPKEEGL